MNQETFIEELNVSQMDELNSESYQTSISSSSSSSSEFTSTTTVIIVEETIVEE